MKELRYFFSVKFLAKTGGMTNFKDMNKNQINNFV